VFFVRIEADGAPLAGLKDPKVMRDGGTPSAGVGGCDFRDISLIFGAEDGVRRDGDMVEERPPPGVAAEGVDADTDGVPSPDILRVSRFCGGGGAC